MLDAIEKGKIDEWMWQKILEKMYEAGDAEVLQERIGELIDQRTRQTDQDNPFESTASKKLTREEMMNQAKTGSKRNAALDYKDFKKIILDFQLQEHERFLVKFTNLYKSIDNDQDGVISEVQFKDMIGMMNVLETEEEIEMLLHKVDPFNNKKMTYSEVVLMLSTEMVPRDPLNPASARNKTTILERYISDTQDEGDELEEGEDGDHIDEYPQEDMTQDQASEYTKQDGEIAESMDAGYE